MLDTLRRARAEWDDLLARAGEAQLEIPGVEPERSAKDLSAHLMAWEQRPVAWLAAVQHGERPQPAPWPRGLDEEQVNAWIYETNRGRPATGVLRESQAQFQQLLAALEALPEGELTREREWLNGNSLRDAIPGNTFEHYRVHAASLREWLARQNS